jgi:S1-C subfamily serine protease
MEVIMRGLAGGWNRGVRRALACALGWMLCGAALAPCRAAETPAVHSPEIQAQIEALARARAAVVGVRTIAVEDARSLETLGRERHGSGVVIGHDGLVVTIGYLVLEADHVELELDPDRVVPARVVAYDLASGFGLLQPLAPLRVAPAVLGSASSLSADDPLVIASGGEDGELSIARLVSRRPFDGYWEYHLDAALFTAPARIDHSGAGLFNARGELLGIGSLIVMDAQGGDRPRLAGNMFLPIDLLKTILPELRQRGATASSTRAWLGVNCVEADGGVRIVRITTDSPAEEAGLAPGDQILRIDGAKVEGLAGFYQQLWRGSRPEREVTLVISREGVQSTVKVQSRDRMKTLRHAKGI